MPGGWQNHCCIFCTPVLRIKVCCAPTCHRRDYTADSFARVIAAGSHIVANSATPNDAAAQAWHIVADIVLRREWNMAVNILASVRPAYIRAVALAAATVVAGEAAQLASAYLQA